VAGMGRASPFRNMWALWLIYIRGYSAKVAGATVDPEGCCHNHRRTCRDTPSAIEDSFHALETTSAKKKSE